MDAQLNQCIAECRKEVEVGGSFKLLQQTDAAEGQSGRVLPSRAEAEA